MERELAKILIKVRRVPGDLFRADSPGYAKYGIGLTAQEAVDAFLMLTVWDPSFDEFDESNVNATESPILEYLVDRADDKVNYAQEKAG